MNEEDFERNLHVQPVCDKEAWLDLKFTRLENEVPYCNSLAFPRRVGNVRLLSIERTTSWWLCFHLIVSTDMERPLVERDSPENLATRFSPKLMQKYDLDNLDGATHTFVSW